MVDGFSMNTWLGEHGEERKDLPRYEFPLLKFQEGVVYQIRLLDMVPVHRYVHYGSIANRTVICPGDNCLFCLGGNDPAVSQAHVNVLDRMDGKVKVLRFPIARGLGTELMKLFNAEGSPATYDIRIVRTGQKRATRYAVVRVDGEAEPTEDVMQRRYDLKTLLRPMSLTEMEKYVAVTHRPVATVPTPPLPASERKIKTFEEVEPELNRVGNSSSTQPEPEEDLTI